MKLGLFVAWQVLSSSFLVHRKKGVMAIWLALKLGLFGEKSLRGIAPLALRIQEYKNP